LASNTLGGAATQSWTLDSQGNWSSYTSNGTTQTQTANAQNQITSISGTSATPTYDANGNMTTDQSGNTYAYNAWNQLVSVSNSSGAVVAKYTYNAMGYRVTESYPLGGNGVAAGTVNYIYYDSQWQAIETRTNGTANSNVTSQMVWSAAYINAAVLQDTYSAGVIQPGSRIYFLQDANWNTTAIVGLVSGNWQVVQRYVYSPYGTITVLNADWSTPPAGTQPTVDNLYQGMALDPVTGLYYARNRNYSPSLGRWINQDPAGYINGANRYQFVMGNPVGNVDPLGLDVVVLVSPGEANILGHAYGHSAIMVGNNTSGWWYYSKNAPNNGSPSGNVRKWYPNLQSFWNAKSKSEGGTHGQRYPDAMRIPEPHNRDAAMKKDANGIWNQPYHWYSTNCADLVQNVLTAGGIPTGNILLWPSWSWEPQVPNNMWNNLLNEYLDGQLPIGTTLLNLPPPPRLNFPSYENISDGRPGPESSTKPPGGAVQR
jgi:RHS repeat-associated protein